MKENVEIQADSECSQSPGNPDIEYNVKTGVFKIDFELKEWIFISIVAIVILIVTGFSF